MARTAGQALFTGLSAVVALILLLCGFLASFVGAGAFAVGMVGLALLTGVVGWVCDSTRDRTSAVARERLNRD